MLLCWILGIWLMACVMVILRDGYCVLCDISPNGPPADWPSYDALPAFT